MGFLPFLFFLFIGILFGLIVLFAVVSVDPNGSIPLTASLIVISMPCFFFALIALFHWIFVIPMVALAAFVMHRNQHPRKPDNTG